MEWFLYDKDLRHERVKNLTSAVFIYICSTIITLLSRISFGPASMI